MSNELLAFETDALRAHSSNSLAAWLHSAPIVGLTERHDHFMKNREVDMGFNLFHLISDVYHRENLHSDMMEAIISPSGSHGCGDLFLRLFLDFLRQHHHIAINPEDYQNAKVVREDGRIDLLIYDEISHRAIIVENKINGAPDMDKQVVRYLEKVGRDHCDAIVYLCLNQKKAPDTPGWTDEERTRVWPLLRVICAYEEGSTADLYDGWLGPCLDELRAKSIEADASRRDGVAHVLRQYRQLILKLGRTLMNKPIMNDFYRMMLDQQQRDSAMTVAEMVAKLPAYRCQRVLDSFHSDRSPFHRLAPYPHSSSPLAIFHGLDGCATIKLHVDCTSQDCTRLDFWNDADDDPQGTLPQQILNEAGMIDLFAFDADSGWFTRQFQFPREESELFQFLREFKEALKKRTSPPA